MYSAKVGKKIVTTKLLRKKCVFLFQHGVFTTIKAWKGAMGLCHFYAIYASYYAIKDFLICTLFV